MKRLALLVIVLAAIAGLLYLADIEVLVTVLHMLPPWSLAALILLFLTASLVKALRWAFYLRSAGLDIRWRDGVTTYLAGMSTQPLPAGSWLAPRLAQEHGHVRMREAAAALFINFSADAIAISLVALAVFIASDQPAYSYVMPLGGLAIGLLFAAMGRSVYVWDVVSRVFNRFRLTQRWLPKEKDVRVRVQALMRPGVLAGGIGFSIATTLLSAGILIVLVDALTFRGISVFEGVMVHSASEATAMALPVPGGLGVVDSSLTGMLVSLSIGLRRATFLALVVRSVDMVFRMFFGTMILVFFYDRFLLNVLDIKARTRDAYRRIAGVPGLGHAARYLAASIGFGLVSAGATVVTDDPGRLDRAGDATVTAPSAFQSGDD